MHLKLMDAQRKSFHKYCNLHLHVMVNVSLNNYGLAIFFRMKSDCCLPFDTFFCKYIVVLEVFFVSFLCLFWLFSPIYILLYFLWLITSQCKRQYLLLCSTHVFFQWFLKLMIVKLDVSYPLLHWWPIQQTVNKIEHWVWKVF